MGFENSAVLWEPPRSVKVAAPVVVILNVLYDLNASNIGTSCVQSSDYPMGEKLGEVAPLRVVTRQQYGLASEDVGVVLQVCVHLALDIAH